MHSTGCPNIRRTGLLTNDVKWIKNLALVLFNGDIRNLTLQFSTNLFSVRPRARTENGGTTTEAAGTHCAVEITTGRSGNVCLPGRIVY